MITVVQALLYVMNFAYLAVNLVSDDVELVTIHQHRVHDVHLNEFDT